jgi:hypothetical protein
MVPAQDRRSIHRFAARLSTAAARLSGHEEHNVEARHMVNNDTHHQDTPIRQHPCPAGLEFRQTGPDSWRFIHSGSGAKLPMVLWDSDDLPRRYIEVAMTRLAASGIDWTQSYHHQLRSNLPRLATAVREAGVAARKAFEGPRYNPATDFRRDLLSGR